MAPPSISDVLCTCSAGLLLSYDSQSAYCQQTGSTGLVRLFTCLANHGSCDRASRTDTTYRRHYIGE